MAVYSARGRRKARLMAVEAVYRELLTGENVEEALRDIEEREQPKPPEKEHATGIIKEYVAMRNKIEDFLKEVLENWDVERLQFLDRAIISTAFAEILASNDVPLEVSINEAIEIAKIYSTDESPKFVNGILDSLVKKIGIKK